MKQYNETFQSKKVSGKHFEHRSDPDPEGNLYSGFKAANADKIFESTNFYRSEEAM